jgi:hypothetical protein
MARRKWNYETIQQTLNGETPFIQVGYEPKKKKRKIGDEWVDTKGRRWKKTENGIVSVNQQADAIRELVRPRCPVCKMDINLFGDKIDHKLFNKTGKCFQCLEVEETYLKVTGQYEKYENLKIARNKLSYLRDFKSHILESINYLRKDDSKLSLVSSNGDIMTWTGSQNQKLLKEAEKDLIEVNKLIIEVENMVETMPQPKLPK